MALPPLPTREARFHKGEIQQFLDLVQTQHRQKLDVVGPLADLRYDNGYFRLDGMRPHIDENGVTDLNGLYRPTRTADHQIGGYFGIPPRYMDKCRNEHNGTVPLIDTNVNEWAKQADPNKNVLYRIIYGQHPDYVGIDGILRSVKSDRYSIRDNWDTTLAVVDGLTEAGLDGTNFAGADITDDRLWLKISAPELFVNAPDLLRGYRDPRTGTTSREVGDVVFAGFTVSNSETGLGSLRITPVLTVLACTNGMTINKAALKQVHLGSRMDEGSIVWSDDTRNAANNLTKLQVRDAISTFLTTDFLQRTVDELTEKATKELSDPEKTMKVVAKKMAYTDDEQAAILNRFVKGGQSTTGGICQAVTSYAQDVTDLTRSNALQESAVDAMEYAFQLV